MLQPFRIPPPMLLPVQDMGAAIPQERAHPDGVSVTDLGRTGQGKMVQGRIGRTGGYRVVAIEIPSEASARGRVIRAHELLHGADTPFRRRTDGKYPHVITNTTEDIDVHCVRWPARRMAHLARDAYAVALQDIRSVCGAAKRGQLEPGACPDDRYNQALAVLARSMGMIRGAACGAGRAPGYDRARAHSVTKRAATIVQARFGAALTAALLHSVICEVERGTPQGFKSACEALKSLMRDTPPPADDLGENVDREGENETPETKDKDGAALTRSPMRVQCLPLLDACDPMRSNRGRSRRGARVHGARLARAVVNATTVGLFIKNRKESGGAVLIDASGSMSFDCDTLAALAIQAPAATVAYYAGDCNGADHRRGVYGTLRIFARNGKRSRTAPRRGGSNDVDLWAVRWLLRQPAPRVLVSDLEFCGGPAGQALAATAEVDRARHLGLIIAPDVEIAEEVFRRLKRGEAPQTIAADMPVH